jgi:hypothetical protein
VLADDELIPYVAVMSAVESLHRMTREERDLGGLIVAGSDHLTAYNVYAEAYENSGRVGEVYGLPRHLFDEESIDEWATRRGVLVKAIEDAALGMASVYRAVGLPLPPEMPYVTDGAMRKFQTLVAQYMPFELVIDEETASGDTVRVSKTSVSGSWGAVAGQIRYFADKFGVARGSIEGTQIPMDLVRRFARFGEPELVYEPDRKRAPVVLRRRVEYFGFELEREVEAIDAFPSELEAPARRLLAEALAREEARHVAVKNNRPLIEEVRETWRRSAGETPKLGQQELTALYEAKLGGVRSMEDFRHANLDLGAELNALVPSTTREQYQALPSVVLVRDREIELQYDVEEKAEGPLGVVRLRLPEKLARTLSEAEVPVLDRPVRFVVTRGARGAARADTLDALQEELDRPYSNEELESLNREWEAKVEARRERKRQHRTRDAGRELRRGRGDRGNGSEPSHGPGNAGRRGGPRGRRRPRR